MSDRTRLAVLLLLFSVLLAPENGSAWGGGGTPPNQQFDFWGFSIAPEPVVPGNELRLVGVITPLSAVPIPLDFNSNEYTIYISGLKLSARITNGPVVESHYKGGVADIYADPSFNAPFDYGTSAEVVPPLDPSEVPANFRDGTLLVRMTFRSFITLFFPASGVGSIAYTATELRATEGSGLPILHQHHMIVGWHMGGGFTNDSRYIPAGYGMLYDPLIRWENPLPVEPATWGGIKAIFK
jgi:hypothetical protein